MTERTVESCIPSPRYFSYLANTQSIDVTAVLLLLNQ